MTGILEGLRAFQKVLLFALILGAVCLVWSIIWLAAIKYDGLDELFGVDEQPAAPASVQPKIVRDPDGTLCRTADLSSDGYCILP